METNMKKFYRIISGCVVYEAICKGICLLLKIEDYDKQIWVYLVVMMLWPLALSALTWNLFFS